MCLLPLSASGNKAEFLQNYRFVLLSQVYIICYFVLLNGENYVNKLWITPFHEIIKSLHFMSFARAVALTRPALRCFINIATPTELQGG